MPMTDKYLNEILANGMVHVMLQEANENAPLALTKFELVTDDNGEPTNAHYVWFGAMKSRYRLTVEMDPE